MRFRQRSEKLPEQKAPKEILETKQHVNSESHLSLPYYQKSSTLYRRLTKLAVTDDNQRQHSNYRKKPNRIQTKTTSNPRPQQGHRRQRKRTRKLRNHRPSKRTPTANSLHLQQRKSTQNGPTFPQTLLRLTQKLHHLHRKCTQILNMARLQPRSNHTRHQASRRNSRPRKSPKPLRIPK